MASASNRRRRKSTEGQKAHSRTIWEDYERSRIVDAICDRRSPEDKAFEHLMSQIGR